MRLLERSGDTNTAIWRYVGAGLLGYSALAGIQTINTLPTKHADVVLLQQANRQGDSYLQGEAEQRVNDDGVLIDWGAVTSGLTAIGGAACILILGNKRWSAAENLVNE